jgi:hypothetical protein
MRSRGGGAGSIEALKLRAAMCVLFRDCAFKIVCIKTSLLSRHMNACLVPHCPSLALAELTTVVAADANDWDSVCTLAQLILQVQPLEDLLFPQYLRA